MNADQGQVQVFAADQGLLVWGPSAALEAFDRAEDLRARAVRPSTMAKLATLVQGVSQAQLEGARYLRLDDASYNRVKELGVKNLASGVLRMKDIPGEKGGQIVKHLTFSATAPANPAAVAALAAAATNNQIMAALDDIQDYLAVIDEKIDRLLKQRKLEIVGQLGGVVFAIEEAETVQESTGHVSAVTWSKVQQNSLILQQVLAEAVSQLAAVADRVIAAKSDVDKLAKVIGAAEDDVQFWLGMLARSMAVQDRQHLLELARVESESPEQLAAHREGLVAARAHRTGRIVEALRRINESLVEAGTLKNLGYVANPISSRRVTKGSNAVTDQVVEFVTHTEIELDALGRVAGKRWLQAAQGLAGEAKEAVTTNAADAAEGVGRFGRALKSRREDRMLAKAEQSRAQRDADADTESPDELTT